MIVVLTTPRSGSTHRCNALTAKYNCNFLGEASHSLSSDSFLDIRRQVDSVPNDSLIKVFAHRIHPRVLNLYTDRASKIFIHGRKDFNEQCRSYYISKITDTWGADPLEIRYIKHNPIFYNQCSKLLINGYLQISAMKKKLTNVEVSFLEDLEDYSVEKKYKQPVVWDQEPAFIKFNTEDILYG